MRFTATTVVLSTLAIGQAAAASIMHNHAALHSEMLKAREAAEEEKRGLNILSAIGSSLIGKIGMAGAGSNLAAPGGAGIPWVGTGGAAPVTNTFYNQAPNECILTIWEKASAWVNVKAPLMTLTIPANDNRTVSFPNGFSGAWAGVWPDTVLKDGQIYETWGEMTVQPPYSTFDVSRLPNMGGRNMSIVSPACTSDMNKCVFICGNGDNRCMTGYQLKNCQPGSQSGANYGIDPYWNAPSGGCTGMGAGTALKTYMGWLH